ncbi:DUF4238 domain-containing protein [Zobellia laminariae]|uniref:DUF4238 domain-containing protein n=1 Tax=Zobellia laminariae TaxID=248906 RepID=UPI003EF42686
MSKEPNTKQHYIPECYLKNFSPNLKFVYIYDKKVSKSFPNSLNSIANYDFFYDIPEKYYSKELKPKYGSKHFEKAFFAEHVEKLYNQSLENIINKSNNYIEKPKHTEVLTNEEKEILAQLIAIQHLRLPKIKDDASITIKKAFQESIKIIKSAFENSNPESNELSTKIDFEDDYDSVLHAQLYANEELVAEFASKILNKHWVFLVSKTSNFYASDNPIIIKNHLENQKPYCDGFGMKGVEVIFPIGKSVLLTLWDEEYFPDKLKFDNTFNSIKSKEVLAYNALQYCWATRQVYSYSNEFKIIELLKKKNNGEEIVFKHPITLVNGK